VLWRPGESGSQTHDFLIIPLRRRLKAAEEALACLLQRFEPEQGSIPVGTIVEARRLGPHVLPRRLLFILRANTARHLAGISAGIGSN
jgi:hypothetical protein